MLSSSKIRIVMKITVAVAILATTGAVLAAATDLPSKLMEPSIAADELLGPEAFDSIDDPSQRSVAIFNEAAKVLTHPRCTNCHPGGDRPRQGDNGQLHEPFVRRGADGFGVPGLRCTGCHTDVNFDPAGVPGAPHWHLAPREMGLHGKTVAAICRQLEDPAQNGNRTLQELHTHVSTDPLVIWGWNPGGNRQPAPGTHAVFTSLIQAWIDNGAVCPVP